MKSRAALLLGRCVCGEPIVRHRRADGRQISCDVLRRIDQEFFESSTQPRLEADRQFQVIPGGRNRDRAIAVAERSMHGGEW